VLGLQLAIFQLSAVLLGSINHSCNIRRFQVVSQTQELLKKHGSGSHYMQHFKHESNFGKHKKGGRKMSLEAEADFIAGRPTHAQCRRAAAAC
jgi:hypothetical protein